MTLPEFQAIPVDQIKPSRHQARRNFDEAGIKDLAVSINKEGLLCPITVRRLTSPLPSGEGGGEGAIFELVAGERRWRAVKLLGKPTIDAKVIETVSEAEAAAKGMIENLQRVVLDPIEEAQGLAELNRLDGAWWTQDRIAEVTGKSQSHISETLRLLKLPEQVQENIRRRIITVGHAEDILRLPDPKLQINVADQIVKKGLTVDQTGSLVNKLLEHKQAAEPKKTGRPRKDPCAALWPDLLAGAAVEASGSWGVSFKKEKWNFEVDSKIIPTREALAVWFTQMGEALSSVVPGSPPSPRPDSSSPADTGVGPIMPSTPLSDEQEQIQGDHRGR